MKLIVVVVIACILLIGFADLASAGTNDCSCLVCGPGGKSCTGCEERVPLCTNLINIMRELERKVRQCVCGEQMWLF
ncbi:salivary glue protein Sgs-8 [Drosophila simulans]|uniref:Salivary gland secretion 8 n=1 Tax=Drosophila simulans TaxID=7240 RepID=A0A0J9RT84_DROSI|nr:salivary glue protein Sgs-8 [Drosophila simulans]KMY98986.1 uncharacterized protein Dsimw501_GD28639 [Drosophila simulans]